MASAKQLSKRYNAETAWSSLGTPKGWQEYYDMSSHVPKYQRLFRSFDTDFRPPRSSSYDYSAELMQRATNNPSTFINPMSLVSNMIGGINSYPQQAFSGALAGKYVDIF